MGTEENVRDILRDLFMYGGAYTFSFSINKTFFFLMSIRTLLDSLINGHQVFLEEPKVIHKKNGVVVLSVLTQSHVSHY